MKVAYREQALADLEGIFGYLEEKNPTAAQSVLFAIRTAIEEAAFQPLGARATSDPQVRVKIVGQYLYKIFYAVLPDSIEILHVRHTARRPWIPEREG
jgi:plasmid stabilization system protein ParE